MPKQKYTVRQPDFVLEASKVEEIFFHPTIKDSKLIMDTVFCTEFSKKFTGVFNSKQQNLPTKKGLVSRYMYCGCSFCYRVVYDSNNINRHSSLTCTVFTIPDTECKCSVLPIKTRVVKGFAREELKLKLANKSNQQIREDAIEATSSQSVKETRNLQDIKTPQTIATIRHELIVKDDLSTDDVVDLLLRAKRGDFGNLAFFKSFPKVSAILTKNEN
jgi:hypothetical protein